MANYETDQECFWAGEFGDEYTDRNMSAKLIASNICFFSRILERTDGVKKVLEIGSNRGLNLNAIEKVIPGIQIQAVEINKKAAEECARIPNTRVFNGSVFEFRYNESEYDLSFTKGVLIHIAPEKLDEMYDILYKSSRRYILIAEYYNPFPVEIPYRGNNGKLFKRDYAGDMLEKYSDLKLIDYGFSYHRDINFPQDDVTWFLMEKHYR